jgi:hypothetical protein
MMDCALGSESLVPTLPNTSSSAAAASLDDEAEPGRNRIFKPGA